MSERPLFPESVTNHVDEYNGLTHHDRDGTIRPVFACDADSNVHASVLAMLERVRKLWQNLLGGVSCFLKRSWHSARERIRHYWQDVLRDVSRLLKGLWHSLVWFFEDGVGRLILGVVLMLALYAVVHLWPDFVMGAWWLLKRFWRVLVWVFGSEAARSLVGVFALFWLYGLSYRYLFLRDKRFITIAPFRVWGNQRSVYLGKDIAARLSDELTRLEQEKREVSAGAGRVPGAAAGRRTKSISMPTDELRPLLIEQAVPEVGVQYEGISPEAVNAFWRRFFDRRLLITGDMIPTSGGLLMIARSARYGTWEAKAQTTDAAALHVAVEELAAHAIIDLQVMR